MTLKQQLYGASLDELKALCEQLELPRFAAKQIAGWLYTRFVTDISQADCWMAIYTLCDRYRRHDQPLKGGT